MSFQSRFSKNLERIRSEPGLGKNVAVIAAVIVLALVAGGWVLGNQRFTPPWADRFQLAAAFEATPGIAPGNGQEVRIAGVLAGQITGAHVDRVGHAVVDMELKPGFEVYDNATLVLRPKSPLNEMYVSINPGGAPGKVLHSGATLPVTNTRRPVQVDEVLSSLDDKARGALTALLAESDAALADAPKQLPGGLDAVADLAETAKPVAAALDQRREHIRDLVTQIGLIADATGGDDKRLAHLADSLQRTLGAVADESGAVDAALRELPAFSRTLGSSTESVKALADQLNPTLKDLQASSTTLPAALRGLRGTADELHTTMTKLRPVARQARPVFADLRPVLTGFRSSFPALANTTGRLDPVTALLTDYLPDLGGFMVQTRSVTSLRDGNAGVMRALAVLTPTSLPKFPLN
jgi:phospholipid/cholesterol/gamma-HCH transport system substrate-binding protein